QTSSFSDWAARLVAFAQSPALATEAAYWQAIENADVGRLPIDRDDGANTVGSSRMVEVSLTPQETRELLHDVPRAYRTRIDEVLLTALAQTIASWSGRARVRVTVEGHGREPLFDDVDLSRTVGWFTTTYPVLLDLTGANGPGDALKAVKEQRRAVPRSGIGYGVLRHLAPRGFGRASDNEVC